MRLRRWRGPGERPGRRVAQLRNIISAYIQLGDLPAAIATSERVLETHPQEDGLWSVYADALQRSDRLDDAITALDRVREINPEHPSAALRQGNWLIQAGRIPDAVEILSQVAQGNPQQAEQAGRLIFNEAYQNGYQQMYEILKVLNIFYMYLVEEYYIYLSIIFLLYILFCI